MNLSKVHHIAIICSDYRRSLDFYTKTLGLRVIAEHYRAARDSYKTDLALGDDYVTWCGCCSSVRKTDQEQLPWGEITASSMRSASAGIAFGNWVGAGG